MKHEPVSHQHANASSANQDGLENLPIVRMKRERLKQTGAMEMQGQDNHGRLSDE